MYSFKLQVYSRRKLSRCITDSSIVDLTSSLPPLVCIILRFVAMLVCPTGSTRPDFGVYARVVYGVCLFTEQRTEITE